MTRITYVYREGKWVDKTLVRGGVERRAHFISTDSHQPFRSMADGKIYDSKSAYRRTLKERGLQEIGNEDPHKHVKKQWNMPPVSESIKQAIEEIKSR